MCPTAALTLLFPLCLPGPSGHSSPLLASLPIPSRPLHPPLDIKHFLTLRLNGTSPLNLFPNFNTVSPPRCNTVLTTTNSILLLESIAMKELWRAVC